MTARFEPDRPSSPRHRREAPGTTVTTGRVAAASRGFLKFRALPRDAQGSGGNSSFVNRSRRRVRHPEFLLFRKGLFPMNEQIISVLVSLIAGGAGGNIVGALLKNRNLGPMLNTVLGVGGGVVGGQVLPSLLPQLVSALGGGNVATGGLSAIVGALLPLIVSFFKRPAVAAA